MKAEDLRPGDRVRLKVKTMCGNSGPGTVIDPDAGPAPVVQVHLDVNPPGVLTDCCAHELARLRQPHVGPSDLEFLKTREEGQPWFLA
jgi:hypothetical protein